LIVKRRGVMPASRPCFAASTQALPGLGRMTDRDAARRSDERRPEQTRLDQRALQQPLRRVARDAEASALKRAPSRSIERPGARTSRRSA